MADPTEMSQEVTAQGSSDDFFSLLLKLLENSWLLLAVSLGSGLIGLTFASLTPARYISAAAIDPVAGLPLDVDNPFLALREERRKLLPLLLNSPDTLAQSRERVQMSRGLGDVQVRARPDGTIHLRVSGPTPQAAKALADAVIAVALEKTRPEANELIRLEAEFKSMNDQAQALRKAGEFLRLRLAAADSMGDVSGQLASNLGSVIGNIDTLERRMTFNRLLIAGAAVQVVLETPTTPVKPAGLGSLAWLAIGVIAGFMLGLTWIFLRESLGHYRPTPEQAARMRAQFARFSFTRKH